MVRQSSLDRAFAATSSEGRSAPPSEKRAPAKGGLLVFFMFLAMVAVTALAWWDDQRESDAALLDLESQQTVIANTLADSLRVHLAMMGVAPAASSSLPVFDTANLLGADRDVGISGEMVMLVSRPGEAGRFDSIDGRTFASPPLRAALEHGVHALRLSRPEAAQVGLPARTAVAGLATLDEGPRGRWGVVAVASAARQRDRERRALRRLVLSVIVTSCLVLAFGGVALRKQRRELELSRELAIAEVQRTGDDALAQAQRAATMGTFALGIAHEVSTPLGVIMGRAEQLIGRVRDDERATHHAQIILKQTDHIQQIVRRFLDMARGGPPSLVRADPSEIARAAAAAVKHRFSKVQVELVADIPAAMPAVQCDRALLEQALVNLLLNSCEACQPGQHVELSARADAASIAFVVTDDGAGIPSELAARATQPFFTTKSEKGGTGLGLAIASEIAKSHRGELTIAANAPRGTRARIEIPVASSKGVQI